jgi:hypothetical protein
MSLSDAFAFARRLFQGEPAITSAAELADFVDRRAAFIAQKCVIEFCRVRAGVYWQKLFEEAEFKDKLNQSCWESFAPALSMILEVIDADLRDAAGLDQRKLPRALEALAGGIMSRYPVPRGAADDFWEKQSEIVAERMRAIAAEPARRIEKMAEPVAKVVFKRLPIHKEIVRHDYDYIRNNLRMNLVRAHEDFIAVARPQEIVADLLRTS